MNGLYLISGKPLDRRAADRRSSDDRRDTGAVAGRRIEERRTFHTMEDKLRAESFLFDGSHRFSGVASSEWKESFK